MSKIRAWNMRARQHRLLQIWVLFGLSSLPAHAQNPEARFDVNCDGVSVFGQFKDFTKAERRSAQTRTFRIDLESRRWCFDKCEETFSIYAINEKFLTLKYEKDDVAETIISINRENGQILDRFKIFSMVHPKEDLISMFTGECKRGNFSGFPALRF